MTLADALSRLPNQDKQGDVPLDIQVDDIRLTDSQVTQQIDLRFILAVANRKYCNGRQHETLC